MNPNDIQTFPIRDPIPNESETNLNLRYNPFEFEINSKDLQPFSIRSPYPHESETNPKKLFTPCFLSEWIRNQTELTFKSEWIRAAPGKIF